VAEQIRTEKLDVQVRRQMVQRMLEIRSCEARIQELFLENVIRGTTHLCDGQEGVSVGMAAAIDAARGDTVTCTYRGHGHALALGLPLKTMMAELMGKESGCCRGKGGSMHLTDMSIGLIGTFAIVGAGLPVANGAALTAQIKGTGAVGVAIFGDGTANIGAFHEALNLAAVWKLPSIFLCENNLYGEYSAYGETAPVTNVADRAAAYNMPGLIVDGHIQAVDRARAGEGPTLIEAKTYRYRGHSRTDPAAYRPAGELDQWMLRDPINILAQRLIDAGQLTSAELTRMKQAADAAVQEATQWAMEQPYPPVKSALEDIWA
jgi:acetoin:2,6-dichlorophenolindophenol oxidoreductase subunit alpha